jgi:hypothetical protein
MYLLITGTRERVEIAQKFQRICILDCHHTDKRLLGFWPMKNSKQKIDSFIFCVNGSKMEKFLLVLLLLFGKHNNLVLQQNLSV